MKLNLSYLPTLFNRNDPHAIERKSISARKSYPVLVYVRSVGKSFVSANFDPAHVHFRVLVRICGTGNVPVNCMKPGILNVLVGGKTQPEVPVTRCNGWWVLVAAIGPNQVRVPMCTVSDFQVVKTAVFRLFKVKVIPKIKSEKVTGRR